MKRTWAKAWPWARVGGEFPPDPGFGLTVTCDQSAFLTRRDAVPGRTKIDQVCSLAHRGRGKEFPHPPNQGTNRMYGFDSNQSHEIAKDVRRNAWALGGWFFTALAVVGLFSFYVDGPSLIAFGLVTALVTILYQAWLHILARQAEHRSPWGSNLPYGIGGLEFFVGIFFMVLALWFVAFLRQPYYVLPFSLPAVQGYVTGVLSLIGASAAYKGFNLIYGADPG